MILLASWAALALVATPSRPEDRSAQVPFFAEISVLESSGGRDVSTEADVARALSDAGISVVVAESFPRACTYRCLHVVVRGGDPGKFYVEVRNSRQAVR